MKMVPAGQIVQATRPSAAATEPFSQGKQLKTPDWTCELLRYVPLEQGVHRDLLPEESERFWYPDIQLKLLPANMRFARHAITGDCAKSGIDKPTGYEQSLVVSAD